MYLSGDQESDAGVVKVLLETQNEFAGNYAHGGNSELQYHWRKETYSGLPIFAIQHIETGETITMSR